MKTVYPKLDQEVKLWSQECIMIGVDEVGRGPLAGPVVACAVVMQRNNTSQDKIKNLLDLGVCDSKKVSPKKRELIFEILTHHPYIMWAIAEVGEKIIDETNILQASLCAMKQAVFALEKKYNILKKEKKYIYVDGREIIPDMTIDQKAIISGDAKIFSIAAASIIAKVTRDTMMLVYAKQYPDYRFEKHKGYGTKLHFELIKKHGLSPIHRRSFLKKFKSE